jgi:hypothetical protein
MAMPMTLGPQVKNRRGVMGAIQSQSRYYHMGVLPSWQACPVALKQLNSKHTSYTLLISSLRPTTIKPLLRIELTAARQLTSVPYRNINLAKKKDEWRS